MKCHCVRSKFGCPPYHMYTYFYDSMGAGMSKCIGKMMNLKLCIAYFRRSGACGGLVGGGTPPHTPPVELALDDSQI